MQKHKKFLRFIYLSFLLSVFTVNINAQDIQAIQNAENVDVFPLGIEIPLCNHTNENSSHEIHTYTGFALCYREEYEQAEWVAYELTREELVKVSSRTNNFRSDPSISTGSATTGDYTKSGFDRGHLAPAGDMTWSEDAMKDSFYMSNMSPQAPSFNRGVWKFLEDKVRDWAEEFGKVYVVSGPILEKPAQDYASIGANKVSVPEYYYKAILAQTLDGKIHSIAFILPNEKYSGSYFDFAVTVDEAERRTGLDFFSLLPDDEEDFVESMCDVSTWK